MESGRQISGPSGQSQAIPEFHSSLTKSVIDGRKQYSLDGKPIGPSYPTQSKEDKEQMEDGVVYSERARLRARPTVQARRNPLSPFLTKKTTPLDERYRYETQEKINIRNEIAVLTEGHPNFAVEIFAGENGKGERKYIRRKIEGFSLDKNKRLNAYRCSGKITDTELRKEFDKLEREVKKKLNKKKLYHNDVHARNIILDTKTNKLVLIDWEDGDNHLQSYRSEHKIIKTIKDTVVPVQRTGLLGALKQAYVSVRGAVRPRGRV